MIRRCGCAKKVFIKLSINRIRVSCVPRAWRRIDVHRCAPLATLTRTHPGTDSVGRTRASSITYSRRCLVRAKFSVRRNDRDRPTAECPEPYADIGPSGSRPVGGARVCATQRDRRGDHQNDCQRDAENDCRGTHEAKAKGVAAATRAVPRTCGARGREDASQNTLQLVRRRARAAFSSIDARPRRIVASG
jgi:hypothetical protein